MENTKNEVKTETQTETQVAPKNESPKGRIRIRQLPERPLGLIQGN